MTRLYGHWWLIALVCTGLLIAAQIWSLRDVERRAEALQQVLSETQTTALTLTRHIGYGGLIHHFKNLVLRPGEQAYYSKAASDASIASELISELEDNAASLGVMSTLESTRAMVNAYRSKMDIVQQLYQQGSDSAAIDKVVRFNDNYAIREIDGLLKALSVSVDAQVKQIENAATLLNWLRTGGAAVLLAVMLTLAAHQAQTRRHYKMVQQLNRQLESGNIKLKSTNTSLEQFAGIVSHDLRTPLRHIRLLSDMMMDDRQNPAAVEQHLHSTVNTVERMDRLIERLLDFTRTGFSQPVAIPLDVEVFVNGVVRELHDAFEAAGAQVRLDLSGTVHADGDLLHRVFHNLLGNCLKYAAADRPLEIEVLAKPIGERIVFSVSDNGIGIEPRYSDRIFQLCQRLHSSQSQYEGSGIGLSLVKAIIDAHQGSIHLDTDYTEGTRIIFSLEIAEPEMRQRAA